MGCPCLKTALRRLSRGNQSRVERVWLGEEVLFRGIFHRGGVRRSELCNGVTSPAGLRAFRRLLSVPRHGKTGGLASPQSHTTTVPAWEPGITITLGVRVRPSRLYGETDQAPGGMNVVQSKVQPHIARCPRACGNQTAPNGRGAGLRMCVGLRAEACASAVTREAPPPQDEHGRGARNSTAERGDKRCFDVTRGREAYHVSLTPAPPPPPLVSRIFLIEFRGRGKQAGRGGAGRGRVAPGGGPSVRPERWREACTTRLLLTEVWTADMPSLLHLRQSISEQMANVVHTEVYPGPEDHRGPGANTPPASRRLPSHQFLRSQQFAAVHQLEVTPVSVHTGSSSSRFPSGSSLHPAVVSSALHRGLSRGLTLSPGTPLNLCALQFGSLPDSSPLHSPLRWRLDAVLDPSGSAFTQPWTGGVPRSHGSPLSDEELLESLKISRSQAYIFSQTSGREETVAAGNRRTTDDHGHEEDDPMRKRTTTDTRRRTPCGRGRPRTQAVSRATFWEPLGRFSVF
ncbi:unnamed protein product [Arctogadus glacialis]